MSDRGDEAPSTQSAVLRIDDDPAIGRGLVAAVAAPAGFASVGATSAVDAARAAVAASSPVITADLSMPLVDGINAMKQLREISSTSLFVLVTRAQEAGVFLPSPASAQRAASEA